jgi:hypothetical protein
VLDADLLAEWCRRTRASLVLTATAGCCAALLVLGVGLLPIRVFLVSAVVVVPLLIGGVLVAVGRWVRQIPFTRRPIEHPALRRIERTANAVGFPSVLFLLVAFLLLQSGLRGVAAFWVPAALVAAAPAIGAAWWGWRQVTAVERADGRR